MSLLIILLIVVIVLAILNSPGVKGRLGEAAVKKIINQLNPDDYIVLNDLMLSNEDEKTTQIDHVVVSRFGIFVVETKNYKGWITGSVHSQYWTQTIYKRKEKLYNPVKQNKGHIKALKSLLLNHYPDLLYISIIVFSPRADLKINIDSSVAHVIYTPQLFKIIKGYDAELLTEIDIKRIAEIIKSANIEDKGSRNLHVSSLQAEITTRKDKIANNICPFCEGVLVNRVGKYGNFKGCSNYPKCKFTDKTG